MVTVSHTDDNKGVDATISYLVMENSLPSVQPHKDLKNLES